MLLALLWLAHGGAAAFTSQPAGAISTVAPLAFGTVAIMGAGTVSMHPLGGREAQGAVYLVQPDQGSPAQLLVRSSRPNQVFSLSLPPQFTLSAASGGDVLRVTGLATQPVLNSTGPGASVIVSIGATLHFTRSPMPGPYGGSFPVTVVYP